MLDDRDELRAHLEDMIAADERRWFVHEMRWTSGWQPDIAALRTAPTRVIVGIWADSAGQVCDRTSRALARALGTGPTMFPGGHIGFVEDPDSFATRLRWVLNESRATTR